MPRDLLLHERTLQDGELADESVEQRQSHRGEEHDHGDGGVDGHDVGDTAIFGDLAGMATLVQNADDQEQRAGRDSVIDLLQDRSAQAKRRKGEDAQRAEAEMANRGIRHQLLHILLHERNECAVDDGNDREDHHPVANSAVGQHVGKERQRETDEAVRSHL